MSPSFAKFYLSRMQKKAAVQGITQREAVVIQTDGTLHVISPRDFATIACCPQATAFSFESVNSEAGPVSSLSGTKGTLRARTIGRAV